MSTKHDDGCILPLFGLAALFLAFFLWSLFASDADPWSIHKTVAICFVYLAGGIIALLRLIDLLKPVGPTPIPRTRS